jgi:lipopolysaccharide transport system permease protein
MTAFQTDVLEDEHVRMMDTLGNQQAAQPLFQIRPPGVWSQFAIKELWIYRDLFWALAVRDVKLRYKQTALGVAWVVLQPLLSAGLLTVVFGAVAKLPSDGLPYFVFAFTGMVAWQTFNSTLSKATVCIVSNSPLVSKVYFPRLILPLSTILSTLVDLVVGFAALGGLIVAYGYEFRATLLLVPVIVALLIVFAMGLGLYTAALMVTYRDLHYVIPYLQQLLMYASPVAFALSAVPDGIRPFFLMNPVTGLLEAFRWAVFGQGALDWFSLGYSTLVVLIVFALGAVSFKRMERTFADVI